MIDISFASIFVSSVASIVIGFLWFHPQFLGRPWMQMTGMTPEHIERGSSYATLRTIVAFFASMLIAWVMAVIGNALGLFTDWIGVLELAFWTWFGFVAPTMLGMVLWEQKPLKFYFINIFYWLASFIVTAFVLFYI